MVKFIVDSTFGLTREFAENNGIKVVGLTLTLDGKEYREGFCDEWNEFYDAYAAGKSAAKTSQPSPDMFVQAIKDACGDEADDAIVFTIGDRLSGTIGSAKIAAMQFPDRRVEAIDSHNGGPSSLMFLKEMLKARDEGKSFDELCAYALEIRDKFSTKFVPVTLTELARSGRVSKLISRIGNVLNIKPVFEYRANELTVLYKALGLKRAMQYAVESIPKDCESIALLYIHDDKFVEQLKERLLSARGLESVEVYPMCPVGGAHIGLGTVGIVTYGGTYTK